MEQRVDVYRNLHKSTWSIRDRTTGLVVGHASSVLVRDATFVVQPAGRRRAMAEGRKNVHAFVRGTIDPLPRVTTFEAPCSTRVSYNPYKAGHFVVAGTGEAVTGAPIVVLDSTGAWIQARAPLTLETYLGTHVTTR